MRQDGGKLPGMTLREKQEQWEEVYFSPYASFSARSRGRDRPEPPCDIRPVYQRDRDRILHSKSFRRLKHKTQVFLTPEGDHYRTRLTHTLEVSQNARTVARALRLNESLVEAIALGHDLGHTPFGHAGERILNKLCEGGFAHNVQSVRVVEVLEKKGEGLNLTWEVRDGILNHCTAGTPHTLEGKIVRYSDKIAYINHDIDDAIRAGILKESGIPAEYREVLGGSTRERLNTLIHDVIFNSEGQPDICMSPHIEHAMQGLRRFMFEHVYTDSIAKQEEGKAQSMLEALFDYYLRHKDKLPEEYLHMMEKYGQPLDRTVCDYISGMTDQYATAKFQEAYIPKSWSI